ncbi:HD family hydrolase [Fervidicoccus fontis]|uniref:HD family hydrolase n=1 Tax=Fervidicoccus fontis TaxID=683846 RepID=A0A7C2VAC1_9CREN|nr:HD family hydrolase [Fervidicoccus fontis]MBE9391742.1 HD family hydrolase [Fervidicoccus fontis]PMB76855.1 MAG: phosphohydrolase [Fervidicoccus fontis]HEW63626.1 HD family hydrolase [Fervidicoccus fontis]
MNKNSNFSRINNCIDALKKLARTGWMQRGIPPSITETVASHSFESATIAGVISNILINHGYNINMEKTISMSLFHDFSECIIGDITLFAKENLSGDEKKKALELQIFSDIFKGYNKILEIYEEYSIGKTLEAKIVKLSDRLSTCIQAQRFYDNGYENVKDIIVNTKREVDEILKEFDSEIRKDILNLCQ